MSCRRLFGVAVSGARHDGHNITRVKLFGAAIFAVIVAWLLSPPQPRPYTIYIVADSRTESSAMVALESLVRNSPSDALNLGDVPVQVKIEKLDSPEPSAAKAKAEELINRPENSVGDWASP